jgi:hypothetical protein
MKRSILMTIHDREPAVLMSTLRSLWRAGVADEEELVLVNDRSSRPIDWATDMAKKMFANVTVIDVKEEPEFSIEGFANPSRAFNIGLEACQGADLWIMSSDVLVNPAVIDRARKVRTKEMIWTPLILDLDTQMQYCGPTRMFPMPWFLVCSTEKAIECGGWDETYMQGMCYEDNDFVGRLAACTGAFQGDWSVCAYHQSHVQPAYLVEREEIRAANEKNKDWTRKKWGGIPFSELAVFDVVREMDHDTGMPIHRVLDKEKRWQKATDMTTGRIVSASA